MTHFQMNLGGVRWCRNIAIFECPDGVSAFCNALYVRMTGLPLHVHLLLASIPAVTCRYANLKTLPGCIDSLNNLLLWVVEASRGLRGLHVLLPVVLNG